MRIIPTARARRICSITAIWLLGFCPILASGQEWTRFRGPNGDGQSDAELPAAYSEKDFNWKTHLPGIGHSSPVLWGKSVFLTSAEPETGARHVLCLNTGDGKIAWQRDYSAHSYKTHTQNSFASSTAAVDAEHVYTAWATPEQLTLVALDHRGRDVWQVNLGPFVSQHGFASSPIVWNDLVILGDEQDGESFMFALDRKDGTVRWKIPRKVRSEQNASYAVPCIRPIPGGEELIVNSWSHGICGLDPRSGRTLWETPGLFERRPVGSPVLVGDLVLGNCGEGSGNNTLVAVKPGVNKEQPKVVYQLDKTSAPYVPTPVIAGPLAFLWGDRGVLSCVEAATGKLHWRQRVGGNYSGSPVRAGGKVFIISADGELVSVAAKDQYELLGRSPLGEASRSTPAIADGRMYLRTESHLISVGRQK